MVHVRLTRKLAEVVNGFNLKETAVGDVLSVSEPIAAMLIREGWGELVAQRSAGVISSTTGTSRPHSRAKWRH